MKFPSKPLSSPILTWLSALVATDSLASFTKAERPQTIHRKVEQVRAAGSAADLIGELADEVRRDLHSVQTRRALVRRFADAVIGQAQTSASGIGNDAFTRKVEVDFDVVNAVLHPAFAFVAAVGQLH